MKKLGLLFLMLTTVFAPLAMFGQSLSGEGTVNNPYTINSADDWNTLAEDVRGGYDYHGEYVSLTTSIEVTQPVGCQTTSQENSRKKFSGIFLGNKNTLTVNIDSKDLENCPKYCAPFNYTASATVKDLRVIGKIQTNSKFASGLIGLIDSKSGSDNTSTIENCHVSVEINSTTVGDGTDGGVIGLIQTGCTANVSNCVFDGKFVAAGTYNCGGFVGYNKGALSFNGCVFNPSELTLDLNRPNELSCTFSRLDKSVSGCNFTNAYYVTPMHKVDNGIVRVYTSKEDDNYLYEDFVAVDGNKYYYIIGENKWKHLQDKIDLGGLVTLTEDLTAHVSNVALVINNDEVVTLDLNGHTLSRDVANDYAIVVSEGAIFTIVDNAIGKNGALEGRIYIDGGQFISSNSFDATVKSTVNTWEAKSIKEGTGWNAIASPVNEEAFASVGNMLATTHNIYLYDPENVRWQEYRNHDEGVTPFTTFENGRGYLYRTLGDDETANIEYSGMLNAKDVEYSLSYNEKSVFKSFNLIGNPFAHNIYKGIAFSDEAISDKYYTINKDGGWKLMGNDDAIPSGAAILVQATEEATLVIKNTAEAPLRSVNSDNIMFTVANKEYSDKAYVEFKEGHGLNKIEHRNNAIPMLYVSYNGEDFASANVSDDIKAISLNFKAMTTGKYTLSYNVNGDFSYLHLIDRMTGEDIDMLLEDEYTFIASAQDNENRFIVRLEYSENTEHAENMVFAYQNGDDIIVSGEGELQIFDVTGRMVNTQNVSGIETVNVKLQGVYVLKLNGNVQKIVVR